MHGFYSVTSKKYVYHKWDARVFWELNETTYYIRKPGRTPEVFSR